MLSSCCHVNLGLPVQHWLAEEAYIFCCCTLFFDRTYRWESAYQAAAVTAPTVEPPVLLIKYPQTSDPCCPPFYRGQNVPNFGPNFDPSRLRTAVFLNCGALPENKDSLSRIDDRSTTTQNSGSVGPPTLRTVGAMGTRNGKRGKFLIYPPFQRSMLSTAPPMLCHLLRP